MVQQNYAYSKYIRTCTRDVRKKYLLIFVYSTLIFNNIYYTRTALPFLIAFWIMDSVWSTWNFMWFIVENGVRSNCISTWGITRCWGTFCIRHEDVPYRTFRCELKEMPWVVLERPGTHFLTHITVYTVLYCTVQCTVLQYDYIAHSVFCGNF